MKRSIADIRMEYTLAALAERDVAAEPFAQFRKWLEEALHSEVPEPTAMTLCTALHNQPAGRIVLLKELDERGLVFFTSYESRKGGELAQNPRAGLVFFWPELQRQVRVEGSIEKVSRGQSEAYFATRPRGSQIGAWASKQSSELSGREELEQRAKAIQEKYEGLEIPCPPHWGGYRLVPVEVEFWQGRANRLHDRICYRKDATGAWKICRLAP